MMIVSCKAKVKEAETSEPDFAKSNDGTMITVALATKPEPTASDPNPSDKPHFCILRMNENDPNDVELLTSGGGLSKLQMTRTLRYMNFAEHTIPTILAHLGIYFGAGAAGVTSLPLLLGLAGVTIAGDALYRVIRGHQEGETGKSKVVGAIAPGYILGPISELIRRESRFKKLASDKEVLKLTDKKMGKVIERIISMKPKYKGTCDHFKN